MAGTLLAAPERCVTVGDNTVSLTGVVEEVHLAPYHGGGFRGFTYVPYTVSARTEYWLRSAEPFRIRLRDDPDCRQDGQAVSSVRLVHWRLQPLGRAVQVTGIMTKDWQLIFLPGRVCSVGDKPNCVDLDDAGEVVGAWTPPRP